jgi:hypothetical protein
MFYKGKEIPIYVSGEGDNIFNNYDFIEFYATLNDGSLDKELYTDSNFIANDRVSMVTDSSFYYLTYLPASSTQNGWHIAGLSASAFVVTNPELKTTSSASASEIHALELDKLPNVLFWRKIMNLHKDSCILNIHSNRTIIATMHASSWYGSTEQVKHSILDSLKKLYGIIDSPRIVGTMGKSFFYAFEKISEKIPQGILAFENNGLDGWYAKAILLIESPNQLQKSNAGAYGPFQLMPGVARNYGLKVNKHVDERADFNRSAYAASELIKTICIPYARQMLSARSINFNENDLWFKLFVMHLYNAGAGNVQLALNAISQPGVGIELIKQLWNTSAGRFKSASQNYSQIILAAFLEYEDRIDNRQ